MSSAIEEHAKGCLLGLAVGDALGAPTEGKSPAEIVRLWGRVRDFLSDHQAGSDDTEYALFNARLLLRHGPALTAGVIADAWRREIISASNTYKGAGFSEMLAIKNLRAGLDPPASGQHAHSWSDGLAMRSAPFGIAGAGNPHLAARLAAMDGSISHAGEGIYAGQAVAAAVAAAMTERDLELIVRHSLAVIPRDSWTSRAVVKAVDIGARSPDVWGALETLHGELACHFYFWSDVAPEAVAMAFGLVAASRGNFAEAVLGAVNIGRDTDTIAGIAGAITGARLGSGAIPDRWKSRVGRAHGTCIKTVAGMDIEETAMALARSVDMWRKDPRWS